MIRALYTAASGMSAQQTNLDTIANNLANSATTGFHQRQVQFEDMIYQNLITPGSAQTQQTLSAGLQVGLGTKSAASEVIMTQGDFNQTNGQFDLAIQGTGFFQISRPDGTIAYTRAGNFHPNSQGTLVTTDGDTVLPAIYDSVERIEYHDLAVRRRDRDAARPIQSGAARHDSAGNVRQSRGLEFDRRQLAAADRVVGKSHYRRSWRNERYGDPAAGVPGELERRRCRGVRSDDPGATRL